jgi:hypothetical protein
MSAGDLGSSDWVSSSEVGDDPISVGEKLQGWSVSVFFYDWGNKIAKKKKIWQ